MGFLSRLTDIDGDEVSLVKRGANRRRLLLMKGDDDRELADMMSVPFDFEGALTDHLRKSETDEPVIEATVAAFRLLKAAGDELPVEMRDLVEKLGSQMYPIVNKPLNNMEGAEEPTEGTNGGDEGAEKADQAPEAGDNDEPDEDDDDGVSKNDRDLLPEGSGDGNVNKEGTVSEGAATVPVPVKKDDGTWDLSGVPAESRPFFEDVLGGRDEVAKQRDELRERLEKAETAVEEERDMRLAREFVAKAEGFKHVAAPDELGPVLKEIAGKIEPEQFEILEKALAAAEERIAKSDLFKEVGRSGAAEAGDESPGDAYSRLEKMANDLVEKGGEMTFEKAFDTVMATPAGRDLYKQYMAEV